MTSFRFPGFVLFMLALATGAAGCGRSVDVAWWQPPAAHIGAAQRVVITDAYGRDDAVDVVAMQARDHILAHGYFQATDRQHRTRLEVTRRGDVWLDTNEALEANTVYVRVDVLEWSAFSADSYDEAGELVAVDNSAHVLLSVTAADDRGLLVDELEVEGTSEQEGALDDDQIAALIESASAHALAEGLTDILPARMSARIPLDDSDEALHAILDADVSLPAKVARLDAFLAQHPRHAAALYDRAAHKDAAGEHQAALADYDAALALDGSRDFYAESRAACVARQDAARALAPRGAR